MLIRIKNIKLTLLGIGFIILFICLGNWQLSRAKQKQHLMDMDKARTHMLADIKQLASTQDFRFYRLAITGQYDNTHTLLLDNATHKGQAGYEVYTPFHIANTHLYLLVDRGFIAAGLDRATLPTIAPVRAQVTITGMLNYPPHYFSFGDMLETTTISWPLRIEYLKLAAINQFLPYALNKQYVLNLNQESAGALQIRDLTDLKPEKHRGYALQWFAFALTLLILLVALNR
jgi:surfeit locus 1 family protein